MKRSLTLIIICVACLICRAADHKSHFVNLTDSADVYKALLSNTPIEPEFMLVPKFAIVGADGKFVFSTGASLKFTTSFDWGNPVASLTGMGPSSLTQSSDGDKDLFQMSAGGSGIYFNIIGMPGGANQIGLFMSFGVDNPTGTQYNLSVGQVYMRYRHLQVGYASSLYNDKGADVFTIDSHGPCSSGAHNNVGINWQRSFASKFSVGVGIEMPQVSYTQVVPIGESPLLTDLKVANSHQTMPDIPLYVQYRWNDNGHVRLSGVLRNLHYKNYVKGGSKTLPGWGLKLTGRAVLGPANLVWMAQGGRGISSYFKDNSGEGLDMVPGEGEDPSQLVTTYSWGFITGLQYNFTPKLFATAQCGYLRNYTPYYSGPSTVPYEAHMRHGFTAVGNLVYKISSLFSVGVEYRRASRTDEAHNTLHNNRVYAMMLMTF